MSKFGQPIEDIKVTPKPSLAKMLLKALGVKNA